MNAKWLLRVIKIQQDSLEEIAGRWLNVTARIADPSKQRIIAK